jgi:poly(A) polymerase
MREIWMMQPRFEKRSGHTPFGLVEQPRFRAAFDFMRLRADVGEVDVVLADWWQEFSQASDTVREDLVAQLRDEQHRQKKARAPRPQAGAAESGRDAARPAREPREARVPHEERTHGELAEAGDGAADAPRKRRRRRRKPAGSGDGESQPASPARGGQD